MNGQASRRGSGTIIERTANTYTVITNLHVAPVYEGVEFVAVTPDGSRHVLSRAVVQPSVDLDATLLIFTSDIPYSPAQVGIAPTPGQVVGLSGFPIFGYGPNLRVDQAEIVTIEPGPSGGYRIGYTHLLKHGMSGGPLVNEHGELIGINGHASGSDSQGRLLSWAIPIEDILNTLNSR